MSHLDEGMLHTYLDGELEPADEAQLREHLATCAACRGRLDAERIVRSRAHEILRYADPPGIVTPDFSEVRARRAATRTPTATAERSRVRPLLLPWAASVVLALGVGWFAQSLLSGDGGAGTARVAIESDAPETTRAVEPLAVTTGDREEAGAPPPGAGAAAAAAAPAPAEPDGGAPAAPRTTAELQADGLDAATGSAGVTSEQAAPITEPAPERDLRSTAIPEREERQDRPVLAQRALRVEPAVTEPETIALDEVTVTGAAATGAETRGRVMSDAAPERARAEALPPAAAPPVASTLSFQGMDAAALNSTWVLADAAAAARELGTAPVVLSDLSVVSYAVTADEPGMVRVVQRLPGGELLEIYQRMTAEGMATMEVILRGEVPLDSLQRLQEELTR